MDPVLGWVQKTRDILKHVVDLSAAAHCNPQIGVPHLINGLGTSLANAIKASHWSITIDLKYNDPPITNQSAERVYTLPFNHCIQWTFGLTDNYGKRHRERGEMVFWRNTDEPPFKQQQKELVKVAGQLVELLFINPSIVPRQELVDVESIGQAP